MKNIYNLLIPKTNTTVLTLFKDFLFKIISTVLSTADVNANQNHIC